MITLVVWIDSDGRVAQHCLRPRCGNCDAGGAVLHWILKVIELSLLRIFLHFEIGEHRLIVRTPVDDPFAAIDQSVIIQTHKDFADYAR